MADPADGDSELADQTGLNRQTYDRIARQYADRQVELQSTERHWLARLETAFVSGLPRGGLVADLGCGPAYDGRRLGGKGLQVFGMDLSAGMLAVVSENLDGRVLQADLRALPIASEHIDGIWNVASLLHVPSADTRQVFREFRRVLKPSGSLVLVTAVGDSSRHEAVPYVADEFRWFVYRDPASLRARLKEAGFSIRIEEEIQGGRHWWTVLASAK